MEDLIKQIKAGLDANLYYLSLFVALAIPDICGAIESENGRSSGKKYKNWFDTYLRPKNSKYKKTFTSEACYQFRCALLHAGETQVKFNNDDYQKILFIEPPNPSYNIHACIVGNETKHKSLLIDIHKFCNDIIEGVYDWMKANQENKIFTKNYKNRIKRYPNGMPPVLGCSVIG